jgi:alkaline phosphatase D
LRAPSRCVSQHISSLDGVRAAYVAQLHRDRAALISLQLFPPIIWTACAIYVPAFLTSFLSQSQYTVVEDDTEITITETSHSLRDQAESTTAEEEIKVKETIILQERPPRIWRTLVTGLPSPSSALWSLVTLLINIALVLATTDMVYRTKVFYPSNDLSFARLGYVSPTEAKLLVREPNPSQLPIFVSYRLASPPASYEDASWQTVGTIASLGNDTDYTDVVTFPLPNHPDRTYQWATSNNHTGYLTVPPKTGHVSSM